LSILFGAGEEAGLAEILPGILTPAAALSFLVVQMLFIPCVATVATVLHETDSWKWTLFDLVFLLLVSFGAAIVVYQLAALFG